MTIIRQIVSDIMVRVHLVDLELAVYHVGKMTDDEVWDRFHYYTARLAHDRGAELSAAGGSKGSGPVFRVAKGAIGNLTIHGMGDRAGKLLPMPVVERFPGSGAAPRK
jgi:hypothetical protein